MKRALFLFLLLFPAAARADVPPLNINVAEESVDITAGFNGEKLSIFGVRREPGDVVVVIRGPETSLTVRRKGQVLGVWMNTQSITFNDVPVYYDTATSVPIARIAPPEVLAAREIGLTNMRFRYAGREDDATLERFREALVRGRQRRGLFPLEPKRIRFLDSNFFRADFYLPPDVPTGVYTVDSYLFRDGAVVGQKEIRLPVAQVGFNAQMYDFAHKNSLLYGLVSVLVAMGIAWSTHMFMRRD